MNRIDNAIILASGYGSRMVPLTYKTPKGLISVKGEPMVERQIKQLLNIGVKDITVVVGYKAEMFSYLLNKYDVKVVYNEDYNSKNTLYTIYNVKDLLKNTLILSSDNYYEDEIFQMDYDNSWYSTVYSYGRTEEWCVELDFQDRIIDISVGGLNKLYLCGPVFFNDKDSKKLVELLNRYVKSEFNDDKYWEDILLENIELFNIKSNRQNNANLKEFDSYEELREFDDFYYNSDNEYLKIIENIFGVEQRDIKGIRSNKKGMTNDSFMFKVKNKEYIMRVPGEWSSSLIDRSEEIEIINNVKNYINTENIIYYDLNTSIKITEFIENARNLDLENEEDYEQGLSVLRNLHRAKIIVEKNFDFMEEINKYKNRITDTKSLNDFVGLENGLKKLLEKIKEENIEYTLCHIDANVDNFLLDDKNNIYLIDWEYAGMQDFLVDIAMMGIYSYLNEDKVDKLISSYLHREPMKMEKIRYYTYIACGGYLWYLWSVYREEDSKENLKDYKTKMLNYAEKYIEKVCEII